MTSERAEHNHSRLDGGPEPTGERHDLMYPDCPVRAAGVPTSDDHNDAKEGRMTIENTATRDHLHHLVGALRDDGVGGYIEDMEAAGQTQLVNSDRLPTDNQDREAMEALGFVFGETDPADPIFLSATLPDGWKRAASDHSMWSHIVDERGIRRVAIFYKAAFYDRSAFMRLSNVGNEVAYEAVSNATLPPWSVLTEQEAEATAAALLGIAENKYEDAERSERARALLASKP